MTTSDPSEEPTGRHDELTGLPDRRSFLDALGAAVRRAEADGRELAILFLDLERFRQVNERFGYRTGDDALQMTAARLAAALLDADAQVPPEGDLPDAALAAYLGADEFAVLLTRAEIVAEAPALAEMLRAILAEPIEIEWRRFTVAPCIGIARFPADGNDAGTLLVRADAAAHRARRSLVGRVHRYDAAMIDDPERQAALEADLAEALERGELTLRFQPQLALDGGGVSGVEALLRWRRVGVGNVPPGAFLPLAERSGLIVPIGDWVLDQACRRAAGWRTSGLAFGRVSVNVSAVQFARPDFPRSVAAVLDAHGLDADALELDLTESVLMADPVRTEERLHALKAIGVRLAIDDFGTGYSSLTHLRRFPVDRLKIDPSFVGTVMIDTDGEAIASAIIAMGERLRLAITAEGVESTAQRRFLADERCDDAQGFGIARPLSSRAIETFLRERGRAA